MLLPAHRALATTGGDVRRLIRSVLVGNIACAAVMALGVEAASAHTTWCDWSVMPPFKSDNTIISHAGYTCYGVQIPYPVMPEPVTDNWLTVDLRHGWDGVWYERWTTTLPNYYDPHARTSYVQGTGGTCLSSYSMYFETEAWMSNIDTHGYYGGYHGYSSSSQHPC
jgi:hypothetical protein